MKKLFPDFDISQLTPEAAINAVAVVAFEPTIEIITQSTVEAAEPAIEAIQPVAEWLLILELKLILN